jgi:hypothetical protein
MRSWVELFRGWMEETHSVDFELRRHFFMRLFDSEFVSTPGQWRVIAGGVVAILASLSTIYIPAYYHKYRVLAELPDATPFHLAVLADMLFLITLSMALTGLFTTLQWPSLFPGLRDYLALASLPVRPRQIFVARFVALTAFAGIFILAVNALPPVALPAVMSGGYEDTRMQVPGIFVSCSLAAWFVFFSLVAIQGVLLNVLPVRWFPRVSLALQGTLLTILVCGFPLVLWVPSLQRWMGLRPAWIVYAPPMWFLGLDQVIVGHREAPAMLLAGIAVMSVCVAGAAAVATYLWSYRRHRVRLLESPGVENAAGGLWPARAVDHIVPDPRELAVFAFVGKILGRSRQHRLVLTAFAALALAMIFESFVSLALSGGFRGPAAHAPAVREAAISAALALSLFVLAGFRYLFRLPVELRANWIFRMSEPGNRLAMLAGAERFLLYFAVIPCALLTLPIEMRLLGAMTGVTAAALCALPSLILTEMMMMESEKIPFTSSYLPGRRPLVETVVRYLIAAILYVTLLGLVIASCLQNTGLIIALGAALLAVWWRLRVGRRDLQRTGQLEFEEAFEPAVMTLSIDRD